MECYMLILLLKEDLGRGHTDHIRIPIPLSSMGIRAVVHTVELDLRNALKGEKILFSGICSDSMLGSQKKT